MTSLPAGLGIVVVSYGYPDLLEENLVGLGRRMPRERIVVVDNFSGLAEREATTALCAREGWTVLAPGLNLGFGAAVNAGVRMLRSRGCHLLLVLDPAVRIDEQAVLALTQACAADPQRIFSPRIDLPDGSLWFGGGTVDLRRGRPLGAAAAASAAPAGWVSGACMMIHAGLWDWVGGFDETYFLHWDDIDLSWRCAAAGGSPAVRDDVRAVRGDGGRLCDGSSPLHVYSACRNRLVFAARHLGRRQLLGWLLFSPGYAADVLRSPNGAGRARHGGRLVAAAVRGTAAGIALALRMLAPSGGETFGPGERRRAPAAKTATG
ncbi:glycosyltransferase [Cryobacterium adonitolivorans]|uniref:glycosyltransferase n=1 Tax=Cryobacterium adonitolivorans TaxID=1259189 RepID=UPI00141B0988|nr:glycosyltransferase [Cryobacterium adonitolivorans]